MEWMSVWAADVLNKYNRGTDGRTPHERQTNQKSDLALPMFGEMVMFKLNPDKAHRNKLETDWGIGVVWALQQGQPRQLWPSMRRSISAER